MDIFLLVRLVLQVFSWILFARVILSWFPNVDRSNPMVRFLFDVTEPVLQPVRELLRQAFPNMGPIDFSPLVVFLAITVLLRLLPI